MRAVAITVGCALLVSCSQSFGPQNELFDELKTTDLSARHASSVKQSGGARPSPQPPSIYPAEDENEPRRRALETAARNTVRRTTGGYQLNFENANIVEIAKVVLGDTLHVPYVIDARVQGEATLSTGRAVSREELVKVFEVALRMNNGALLADGAGYRIVQAGETAAGDGGGIQPLRRGEEIAAGFGVTAMPLHNITPEAMLRLLDSFLARAGAVRAFNAGNLLLIRGGARERESIIDAVDLFDVDWLKGQSAGIFPLTHANPDEVVRELQKIMLSEASAGNAGMIRFEPILRLNAVLVLTRRREQLELADTWIRRLDQSNSAGHNLYVYQVENGKAADIAQILNDTFGVGGGSSRRTAQVAPGRGVVNASAITTGSLSSAQPPLGGGQAASPFGGGLQPGQPQAGAQLASPARTPVDAIGGVSAGIPSMGGGPGGGADAIDVRIIANEANNSLLIRATLSDYEKIRGALRQIDKPPLQVAVNATIAEVTLNDALQYGVQFYLQSLQKPVGAVGFQTGTDGLGLQPALPGFNLLYGVAANPKVVLDALATITSVKVVSSPSVVVVDNQPATLKVGDEVPITTSQQQSTIAAQAPVINTVQFRETGVILKVTPRVNSSGLVTMDVDQEVSQVVASSDGSTSLTPTISQRHIASTVSVYSGQTVALGGLISEQDTKNRSSIPILNRVPVIGDLVGETKLARTRTEIIVFIKPDVIRNSRDAARVSDELRSKLKSMAFEAPPPDPRWSDVRTQQGSIKDAPSIKDEPRLRDPPRWDPPR